jgi:hypothetical protein
MSYDDAMEGAKSNSIMRLGKTLGMFWELWDPGWRDPWCAKNVESYEATNWKGVKVKAYRRKAPELLVQMGNSERSEILKRMMSHHNGDLLESMNTLDEYWVKKFKHSFTFGYEHEAKMVLEALDEKESKEAVDVTEEAPVVQVAEEPPMIDITEPSVQTD